MKDPVILLDPRDNVVVCRRAVAAGEFIEVAGRPIVAGQDVQLGHKIAAEEIKTGAPVIKYGMSIGVATAEISPGDWVHLHNMRSSYLATHTRTHPENSS